MTVLDQNLTYSLKKTLEIINNLPEEDRKYVETYINSLKAVVENTKECNERMINIFKQITYYGK